MKRLLFAIALMAFGCHSFKDRDLHSDGPAHAEPVIADTTLFQQVPLASRAAVKSFYASQNFRLLWTGKGSYKPVTDSLLITIRTIDEYGLNPGDYHFNEIRKIMNDSIGSGDQRLDLLLTDAFLTLHQHLQKGRLDPLTLQRIDLSQKVDAEAVSSLGRIHQGPLSAGLRDLEPKAAQYQLLKRSLKNHLLASKEDSVQQGRAQTIALNMERWRWEKNPPDRYVAVNIPAFILRVFEADSIWLETPVIVGKRKTPTPILESVIRSFTIYPYWHVPHSISTKEILPSLQADASYLGRNNFEVLDRDGILIASDTIQWKLYAADRFPFILRQREGTENSMGIIKFNFANNYNVYLHDTNSKRLFAHRKRDFSHGCVRVKAAVPLAHYLVREDDIYVSPEDLDQYLSLQQRLNIDLRKPIAVRLKYFTAEVQDGKTFFYDDIYRKDSLMQQALYHHPQTAGEIRANQPF